MIKIYSNGADFINENKAFLDENIYMSSFFFLDAPLLTASSKKNYALKVSNDDKQLLALKVEPYHLMLYGHNECLEELLLFIRNNGYEINGVYCADDLGNLLMGLSKDTLNKEYHLQIGMDFMEANEITEPSSSEIERATVEDVDELYECLTNFMVDCGLTDEIKKDSIIAKIDTYRLIRLDHKIVSVARKGLDSNHSIRISMVYTRPEYRNQGLARKVVNTLKNEILADGQVATLHVDKANPISNHLYQSLGFKKVFSRSIYLPISEKFYFEVPTIERKEDALAFINEFLEYSSNINGTGSLKRYTNDYEGWLLKLEEDYKKEVTDETVPSRTYFFVRQNDHKIIGMINIRLVLNERLKRYGGHIGYCIRPTERRKGYNKINLYLALKVCDKHGIDKVLLDADLDNPASWKTMEAFGGKRTKEYFDNEFTQSVLVDYEIDVKQALKDHPEYEQFIIEE